MKKLFIIMLSLFIIIGTLSSTVMAETDFRGVSWGMSEEKVSSIEGTPDRTGEDYLDYLIKISEVNLALRYHFIDDSLVKASFINNENYMDNGQYYNDYKTLNNSLKQVHGEPNQEITNWEYDMFEAMYPEKMGFELGMVSFYTNWEKERTKINHILTNEDILKAAHGFIYESLVPEHQELMSDAEQEELEQQL